MAGQINPMNGSASISIPPEIQRILQDGMQSILERSVKDGPAQFEYVETDFPRCHCCKLIARRSIQSRTDEHIL
jgi:hypothetical protein